MTLFSQRQVVVSSVVFSGNVEQIDAINKDVFELAIVWLLGEAQRKDVLGKAPETFGLLGAKFVDAEFFLRFGDHFHLEGLLPYGVVVDTEEVLSIEQVDQQVDQRVQVVSPTCGLEVQLHQTCENKITFEVIKVLFWDVFSTFWAHYLIWLNKTQINELEFNVPKNVILILFDVRLVNYHNVIQFEVVVCVTIRM